MEFYDSKVDRKRLEPGNGIPWLKEYAARHTRCKHQPASLPISFDGHSIVSKRAKSVCRTDPAIVVPRRSDGCGAAVVAALSAIHDGGVIPRQRWQFHLRSGNSQIGETPFSRVHNHR